MTEKVVVIGMGIISAIGMNREETINNIKSLKDGLVKKDRFFEVNIESIGKRYAGEVDLKNIKNSKYDKNYLLSMISLKEAIKSSNINIENFNLEKIGIFFGSCNGNLLSFEKIYRDFDGPHDYTYNSITSFNAGDVAIDFYRDNYKIDILGPKYMFSNACSSSNMALSFASNKIKNFDIDVAFVGGSDTLSEITLLGFDSFKSISREKTSSFSINSGLNLGEGASWIILTRESLAKQNNHRIFAEINGSASYLNGNKNIVSPDIKGETLSLCMDEAIKKSSLNKKDIKVICAHGTGTELNNISESNAIKKLFLDEGIRDIFITSIKPYIGHTLGASGLMQNVIMIDCMNLGLIPPILHFSENNSVLEDKNIVKNNLLYKGYDHFLSNSSAFGGNDVSIVISKYKDKHKYINNIETKKNKIFITNISMHTPIFSNFTEFYDTLAKRTLLQTDKKYITYDNFLKNVFLKDVSMRRYAKNPDYIKFSINLIKDLIKDLDIDRNLGLFFSNYQGICSFIEDFYLETLKMDKEYASATKFQNSTFNATIGHISNIFGIKGFGNTFFGGYGLSLTSLDYGIFALENNFQKSGLIFSADAKSEYYNRLIHEKYYDGEIISEGSAGIIISKEKNENILGEIAGFSYNTFYFHDENLAKKTFTACINETLSKSNIKLKDIDIHISKNFFMKKETDFASTKYTGFLETSSPLIDIIMAIYFIKHENCKNILISVQSLQGTNHSFLVRKV